MGTPHTPGSRPIYLDWNATTPPHPSVTRAMAGAMDEAWANPASVHAPGRRARALLDGAREAVAALIGFDARDVVLTSGGTEANNMALAHPFAHGQSPGSLVVARIEHPSIVRAAERLADSGVVVEWAEPDRAGAVSVEQVLGAVARATARAPVRVVAVQAVNHETGVIQPIAAIAEAVHARGALLHVDAVQAVGRLASDTWSGADSVSVAAHKIRGPKGVGALVVRSSVRLRPILFGGAQERGLRPGTQDPVACAGFAVAAERAATTPTRYADLAALRDLLAEGLGRLGERHRQAPLQNGEGARAPHVLNLSWPGWSGAELCAALDLEGVAVSSGSACSAGTAEPSPVLRAMLGEERALSAVRVSLGEDTTREDVLEACARWERVLARASSDR